MGKVASDAIDLAIRASVGRALGDRGSGFSDPDNARGRVVENGRLFAASGVVGIPLSIDGGTESILGWPDESNACALERGSRGFAGGLLSWGVGCLNAEAACLRVVAGNSVGAPVGRWVGNFRAAVS